jgi:hypothetical protein
MRHNLFLDLLGLAITGGGLLYHHFFNHDRRVKRALARVPQGRIGSTSHGQSVRVVGRLDLHAPALVSPLSERTCAYYELVLEESRGKNGWATIGREARTADFVVQDGSGTALVRTASAEVSVVKDEHHACSTFQGPDADLMAMLDRFGEKVTSMGIYRGLRCTEGVLEAGEHVAVCGPARRPLATEVDAAAGDSAAVRPVSPVRIVFEGCAGAPLYVSDDPRILYQPKRGVGRRGVALTSIRVANRRGRPGAS